MELLETNLKHSAVRAATELSESNLIICAFAC